MNCPSCGAAFRTLQLTARLGNTLAVDACQACQLFWFDPYESLQLSAASTLQLFALIGEAAGRDRPRLRIGSTCPRCHGALVLVHDRQRNTPFSYWRCEAGHGRLTMFYDFLREKDFLRPLTPQQLVELRQRVRTVNCSNCGAPIDLTTASACSHCGSPLALLDLAHAGTLIGELRRAADDAQKPPDPELPLKLAQARAEALRAFNSDATTSEASSDGLIGADLRALGQFLRGFGLFGA